MYDQIKQLLIGSFHAVESDFTPHATLGDLGLDSLDLVELSMTFEQWGARVSDDELAELEDFEAVVRLVEDRGAKVA
ncbi:acyl carrier protein [Streptomyces polygonati]|uniref:Acyl carrier protein n=1 Tax=Streptomyces polygonati TaxID=1617087 RepID=A0ABV8HI19_9ACTN